MTTPSDDARIHVQNERVYPVEEARLRAAALTVLTQQDADPQAELSLILSDDATVRELNQRHRGIDAPTDVLSFPADPLPPEIAAMSDEAPYLGDLVIAYPYALAQAQRAHQSPEDSFALLVIHGTLHLLGYDHDTPAARTLMWREQARALHALGLPESLVPNLEDSDPAP